VGARTKDISEVGLATAKTHGLTVALSVAVHAVLTAGVSFLAYRSLSAASPAAVPAQIAPPQEAGGSVAVDLPQVGEGIVIDEEPVDPVGEPPRETAGATAAHPDTGRAGQGGAATALVAAQNLSDADERMRLSPDPMSRLDRDQVQRLRVARARASWEDRRSTTHPAELTLVTSGFGRILERRAISPTSPSRGAWQAPRPSVRGASLGSPAQDGAGERPGGEQMGGLEEAPGLGLAAAAPGRDHRSAAPIGSARPAVAAGPVAVQAALAERPRDNVDSEQEVATAIRSLVHASTAGGEPGPGSGGSAQGLEAGEGGPVGGGFRAVPLGAGEGEVYDYWTRDPRLLPYFRQIHARIDPLWADAFPKSALLELKQGTTILEFTVSADGHVAVGWPPVRPSGIDEFDRNCAEAIRRAGPFPPIPAALGVTSLRIRAPFAANNPMVK
jgi:TonB family protein